MDESYNPAPKIYIIIRNDISYINNGSTFRRTDWWVNFFNVQIIVSELQRFSSKLLTVKSDINIKLHYSVMMLSASKSAIVKLWYSANDCAIFIVSIAPIPTSQGVFLTKVFVLSLSQRVLSPICLQNWAATSHRGFLRLM